MRTCEGECDGRKMREAAMSFCVVLALSGLARSGKQQESGSCPSALN